MNLFVDLQIATEAKQLPDADQFNTWVRAALDGQRDRAEVCIRLVDEVESRELNNTWRGKDSSTNVLSFPFESPPGIAVDLIGDLVICADVVAREAEEQSKPLLHHWAHMVIHGTLHLIGFDHINDDEAEEMETLECTILSRLNIPDPYQSA
ncbi:rRNA maturation RNase YbeY [Nitrincola alkalilacustris]|uniref:rRNA maturation RNase YbeY n=1 Tax=Nitrincola alkalilacustris TaxID=1571224 RepID=UPI00124CFEB0|nr:rRNA maturation RNase YbeY [Nitrincola alkalilacustris]